ncbi:hypothetical protein CWC28_22385, partial [Pseudoalteromonas sp. S4492]|uniref:hypothetical protein n=1 Tax=Pseudoalteromonas sp. S4492 TaxID=579560 RepID=UPI0012835D74
LRTILLILALPLQVTAGEITQEMMNVAATAHAMSVSGLYSMNAEGAGNAAFYEQLKAVGAVSDDHILDPAFAEAY